LHRHSIVTDAPLVDQPTPFTCGFMALLFLPLCRLFQVVLTDARNKKVFYRFQAICRGWVLRHRRAVAKERAIRQQGAVRVKLSACCCLAHGRVPQAVSRPASAHPRCAGALPAPAMRHAVLFILRCSLSPCVGQIPMISAFKAAWRGFHTREVTREVCVVFGPNLATHFLCRTPSSCPPPFTQELWMHVTARVSPSPTACNLIL
jgi:hypothetical protein